MQNAAPLAEPQRDNGGLFLPGGIFSRRICFVQVRRVFLSTERNAVMLKMRHLIENFDLAREALSHFEHDAATLNDMLSHFRISANAIYPYLCGGQPRFLRLAPVDEKDERALRAEQEFLFYLAQNDYPAMRPVPAKNGETLLRLHTRWGEYFACAFTGVPGMPIEDMPLTEPVARQYGRSLGRLHALSAKFAPTLRRMDHTALLTSLRASFAGDPALADVCDRLAETLALLPRTGETYGLVHYDFEPDNVFYDTKTGLCHAIDFDDSLYCWYALDIEQALDCIAPAFHAAFLAGYAQAHPLDPDLSALRPLLRRLIDLRALARIRHCLSDPVSNEPNWMPHLRARLQHRADELRAKITAEA